jgi:hypothetical protein
MQRHIGHRRQLRRFRWIDERCLQYFNRRMAARNRGNHLVSRIWGTSWRQVLAHQKRNLTLQPSIAMCYSTHLTSAARHPGRRHGCERRCCIRCRSPNLPSAYRFIRPRHAVLYEVRLFHGRRSVVHWKIHDGLACPPSVEQHIRRIHHLSFLRSGNHAEQFAPTPSILSRSLGSRDGIAPSLSSFYQSNDHLSP